MICLPRTVPWEPGSQSWSPMGVRSGRRPSLRGFRDASVAHREQGGAAAQPEQAAHYRTRADRYVARGDCTECIISLVAPEWYIRTNEEAGKYPNSIRYEALR